MSGISTQEKSDAASPILVVCASRAGEIDSASKRMISTARLWAMKNEPASHLYCMLFGEMKEPGKAFGQYGAAKVYNCRLTSEDCKPQAMAKTVAKLAMRFGAKWIFMPHQGLGTEIAPFVAAWLDTRLVSRCLKVEPAAPEGIMVSQSVQEGWLQSQQTIKELPPFVISWDASALEPAMKHEAGPAGEGVIEAEALIREQPLGPAGLIKGDPGEAPLEEAEYIVALGRGMTQGRALELAGELASQIQAAMGVTRPVVDEGLLPFERQIGQTGVSVRPRLMVTCGISGANEFVVGIEEGPEIIAINTDAQARIFQLADLGLIGDGVRILENALRLMKERQQRDGGR